MTDHPPAVTSTLRPAFPFTALVGQPTLQLALQLAAIDPGIGGVLISGPRGTAKSTAARALAALLPGAPFVTLPLAASLEQLVGTLNVEDVLRDGQVRLAPGLVARAHEGVLYVDEVNLLPDALVDALLDVAASGVNTVERDGISHQHAARFVLVGTMNPEEGDLRPQLLDRFGLSVTLDNPTDAQQRAAILRARLDFDADPLALAEQHAPRQHALGAALVAARAALPRLAWSDEVLRHAADRALNAGVDGVRADLVMLRAARALAALQARAVVTVADVDAVAELALAHRRLVREGQGARDEVGRGAGPQASGPAASAVPQTPSQGVHAVAPSGTPRTETRSPAARHDPASKAQPAPQGDWGALPAQPEGMTAVPRVAGWPAKKA
ncbi:magnesium chelatase [Hylemonella gracilis str. Niagara R]|uniref:Magnesium chelatase n=1 Tax=Hylemonella gracilis str. Niagara R TaxID=1458275 RepID=A0A016XI52_9BURK|nr:ATP-binding protein [Hylemonella gracilis]EYC51540.1 magnesium chelatase [Hylemonella gracilis str. Niagara R]